MILACPSCATRFSVSHDVLAAGARRVRCAQCRHVWTAYGDAQPESATEGQDAAETASGAAPDAAFADILAGIAPDWAAEQAAASPHDAGLRRWGLTARRFRISAAQAKIISVVLTLAILLLGLTAHRQLAVRIPALASLYAMIGLQREDAAKYFDLQLTRVEKCLVAGRDMLCIEGSVTHKGGKPMTSPRVKVTGLGVDGLPLTDAGGRATVNWTIRPETGRLAPGETKTFILTTPLPDQTVADFDYGFAEEDTVADDHEAGRHEE